MTTARLIAQSLLTLPETVIQHLAQTSHAKNIVKLNSCAYRFEDVQLSSPDFAELQNLLRTQQIDLTYLPAPLALSNFKLLAMDMDSTLITIECIDEIADMQGLKPQVAEITEAAMRGELEFQESLRRRVALLKGLDATALQRVLDERLQLSRGGEHALCAA